MLLNEGLPRQCCTPAEKSVFIVAIYCPRLTSSPLLIGSQFTVTSCQPFEAEIQTKKTVPVAEKFRALSRASIILGRLAEFLLYGKRGA